MIPNPLVLPHTSLQSGSNARAEGSALNPYCAPKVVRLCVLNLSASALQVLVGKWTSLCCVAPAYLKNVYLLALFLRPYAALGWHFLPCFMQVLIPAIKEP